MNWIFAGLFLILAIYILSQIYPFFVDKGLNYKHPSIMVMTLLGVISILYVIICIQFHALKYDGLNDINIHFLEFFLLFINILYFIIFSIIFFTWFKLAHSMDGKHPPNLSRVKKRIISVNILIIIFTIIVYSLFFVNLNSSSSTFSIYEIFAIIWSCILIIICIMFMIYAYNVGKVLLFTIVLSQEANMNDGQEKVAKKLLFINTCIIIFFVIQTTISLYFTIQIERFNIWFRFIDLLLNMCFILIICWMYRNAMNRVRETKATKPYSICYCCPSFSIPDYLQQISRDKSVSTHSSRWRNKSDATSKSDKNSTDMSGTGKTETIAGEIVTQTETPTAIETVTVNTDLKPMRLETDQSGNNDTMDLDEAGMITPMATISTKYGDDYFRKIQMTEINENNNNNDKDKEAKVSSDVETVSLSFDKIDIFGTDLM